MLTEQDIKRIFHEVHNEIELQTKPERDAARQKVEEMHLAIKGNKDLGIVGIADNVSCLLFYKPELKTCAVAKENQYLI